MNKVVTVNLALQKLPSMIYDTLPSLKMIEAIQEVREPDVLFWSDVLLEVLV